MEYLSTILNKETNVYKDYLRLAKSKKQALMHNDMQALEAITVEEKGLSTKILALEAARNEFLRDKGYKTSTTVDELVQSLDSNHKEAIRSSADGLKSVLIDCKKFNDDNMMLLRQSSNYINHMIKIFTKNIDTNKQVTYSKDVQKFLPGKIADMQG